MKNVYENCNICPRKCNFDRTKGVCPICHSTGKMMIAHTMLHKWEEPCISGTKGSGTIFFSGCSLNCVYCQNYKISRGNVGREASTEELIKMFFDLKNQGAHNINLITMTHFTPSVAKAIMLAKEQGFDLPFISNTSGYENVETLKTLEGLIDIYLTDFKYMDKQIAKKYSMAENYTEFAKTALMEMFRQQSKCQFYENGLMKKGIIVRHLCLPGHTKDSKEIIKYVHENYGCNVMLSIMNQYTVIQENLKNYPEINRNLTKREYENVVNYALSIGVGEGDECFFQEGETCKESFIPGF